MPSPVRILEIDGHRLAATTLSARRPASGSRGGFPVIFLHGVMSSLNFWTPYLVEPFVKCGPCISLSLPGHYPAEFAPGFALADFSADWLAGQLLAAMQALVGDEPALLVGHSTGGFAALAAAAHDPQRVCGVASIAGFAQGRWGIELRALQYVSKRERMGQAVFASLLRVGAFSPLFRLTARWHTPLPPGMLPGAAREALIEENLRAFRGFSPEAMRLYFTAMWEMDILPLLGGIRAPALVLNGDRDHAVPPEQSDKIYAALPNAERAVIKGAGHHPFYERPAEYLGAVNGWLRRHFG